MPPMFGESRRSGFSFVGCSEAGWALMGRHRNRAVFFIDGNNWFHSLREAGVPGIGTLRYPRICGKLVGSGTWHSTRYYVPDVSAMGDPRRLAAQRSFLRSLKGQDRRITVHLGRIERRPSDIHAGRELLRYLANLPVRIPRQAYQVAVDMVAMAYEDLFDRAYLLSADGDFTPAVEAVRKRGKKVFALSPASGAKLAAVVDDYIRLRADWFVGCW